MRGSSFDLQFSLYDKSDDENAVNVKDKVSNELSTTSEYGMMYIMMIRFSYFMAYIGRLCFTAVSGVL